MAADIFRNEELLVRGRQENASGTCVITFDSYTDHRTLDRLGFGEAFLEKHHIDAIHFIQRNNDWYLYPEMANVCAMVREQAKRYDRVIAYGQSMGGYAAIRFGSEVGASLAIAISPQFSINRKVVPCDRRWISESVRLDFSNERTGHPHFVPSACVLFDPYTLDARHVALYRPHTRLTEIRLPDSGHPSTAFLAELGLLQDFLLEACSGTPDPKSLQIKARQARRGSAQFYFRLARRCKNVRRKLVLAAKANALQQKDPNFLGYYAYVLGLNKQFEMAHQLLEEARQHDTYNNFTRHWESELYLLQGNLQRALELTEEVLKRDPKASMYIVRRQNLKIHRILQFIRPNPAKLLSPGLINRDPRLRRILRKPPGWDFILTWVFKVRRFFNRIRPKAN